MEKREQQNRRGDHAQAHPLIAQLHEQGMFELRGAVQFTVKKLSCSQASIYRYIKKARAGEEPQHG